MIEARAYSQVSYIINLMSENLRSKIPQDFIDVIEKNKDKDYIIKERNINDMIFLSDTEKILSVIYTDYIANEEEKKIIKNKEKVLSIEEEQEKRRKYNVELFKEKNIKNRTML